MNDNEIIDGIVKRRVGRALEALDLANVGEHLKKAVKKQFWELANDIKDEFLAESTESKENESTLC